MRVDRIQPFGAEVRCDSLGDENAEELKSLLFRHGFLVLRGSRSVSPADLVRLSEGLGRVLENPSDPFNLEGDSRIQKVSNERAADGSPRGLFGNHDLEWHNDYAHSPGDFHGTLIHNVRNGGLASTWICDTRAAFRDLDAGTREMLTNCFGFHQVTSNAYRDVSISPKMERLLRLKKFRLERSDYSHHCIHEAPQRRGIAPIHPWTGEPALYLGLATLSGTDPLIPADTIRAIARHCEKPEYLYEHHWQTDDILVLDNLSTMHRRGPFQGDRMLYRVQFDFGRKG